jgi:hypothetical protein
MKRHPALIPLSHDHHRALVEARRLRAADAPESAAAATAFLRFFADETIPHFRQEEELLFQASSTSRRRMSCSSKRCSNTSACTR